MDIFISYRRDDSADVTGRIYDRLINSFGETSIFKDVDSIPFGVNFKTFLDDIIKEAKVFLVVIGPRWLSVENNRGERRLDDPADFVRIEVEAALKRKIIVIPLLVSGASMPNPTQLPSSLEELTYYNGTQIRPDPDFHKDMDRLINQLGNQIKHSGGKTARNYYPRSTYPSKSSSVLSVSLNEILSIVKVKLIDFPNFLKTPLGQVLSRIVLGAIFGGITLFILESIFQMGVWDIGGIVVIGCGISGLIIYPHRKTILYVTAGIIFIIVVSILLINFAEKVVVDAFGYNHLFTIIFCGLLAGPLLGAIVSRIQHLRKKI